MKAIITMVSGKSFELDYDSNHLFSHEMRRMFDTKGVHQFISGGQKVIINSSSIESIVYDAGVSTTPFNGLVNDVTPVPTAAEVRAAQLKMQPEALIYEAKEKAMLEMAEKESKAKEKIVKIYKDKVAPPEVVA